MKDDVPSGSYVSAVQSPGIIGCASPHLAPGRRLTDGVPEEDIIAVHLIAERRKLISQRLVKPFQLRSLIVREFALQNHVEVYVSCGNRVWERSSTIDIRAVQLLSQDTLEAICEYLTNEADLLRESDSLFLRQR